MRILELYSGIGGMHFALKESGVFGDVIAAVDINTVANAVYKHNFPQTALYNRNIQSLTPDFINKLKVDTILMSPPCQPFTRNGLKQDITDPRTCSFSHVLQILPQLNIKYILIENVKGFETSEMHCKLKEALDNAQCEFKEFILSPTQFGIPNSRYRYYCLARKISVTSKFDVTLSDTINHEKYPISDILEDDINVEDYQLSDKILQKRAHILDICYSDSCRSCCFTKAYGRYVEGTGSVFTDKTKQDVDEVYADLKRHKQDSEEYLNVIRRLNLRFFTPLEVSRLMKFPSTFKFPCDVSNKQRYMLLGNSINIKVVSELIKMLAK